MTITFDLLLYLYQTTFEDPCVCTFGAASTSEGKEESAVGDFQPISLPQSSVVRRISTYCGEFPLTEDTLYILSDSSLPTFSHMLQEQKKEQKEGQKEGPENISAILVTDKSPADSPACSDREAACPGRETACDDRKAACSGWEAICDDFAIILSRRPPFSLTECLSGLLQQLQLWEAAFVKGILDGQETEDLLLMIRDFLPLDFALVDLDMNYIYFTKGYADSRNLQDGLHTPTELFQDLVSRKRFHAAALEKSAFYYYTDAADTMNLCQNIFSKGHYIARIVAVLPPGQRCLPVGAERFFSLYAACVQELFAHRNLFPARQTRDQMHRLCHRLLQEETCAPDTLYAILKQYHWTPRDTFLAVLLRFNTEPEWNAQLYLVLPYLAAYLEREWSHSCAVHRENEILLILNFGQNVSGAKPDLDASLRKIAYFVRDNICKAGVSPLFEDFSQLAQARLAANAALEIGTRKYPHLWYYRFDDLRLAYLTETMKKAISASFLRHPALRLLERYDASHQSELTKTLETYLVCNLNMTLAAEKLYIHRTSFCRRMNTIKKLTGLDLTDSDTILTLLLSFRL